MKRALMVSASFVLAAWAAPGATQILGLQILPVPSILAGKYGVTGTVTCNLSTGVVAMMTTQGVYTFYGDGTGTATETALGHNAGVIGSTNVNHHTFTFRHTVNNDNTFTLTTNPGSFTGTFVSGPNAGFTFSLDQMGAITGFIGANTLPGVTTLTGVTQDSPLETITISNGGVVQRRCQRLEVFLKQ